MNSFQKYYFLLFYLLLSLLLKAGIPDTSAIPSKTKYTVQVGLNASRLRHDSFETEFSYLPCLGIYAIGDIIPGTTYRIGGGYSMRGSSVLNPYGKFYYHYIDLQGAVNFKAFENIRIEAGLQPAILLKAFYQDGIESENQTELDYENLRTEVDAFAGIEFKLQERITIGARFFYPLSKSSFQNMQFYINIPLSPKDFHPGPRKEVTTAKNQIEELKNGALVIRLKTNKNIIEKLISQGNYTQAEEIRQKQYLENKEIIQAFKANFKFCPILFIFNTQTDHFLQGAFEGIFLNDSLKEDSSIVFNYPTYFIAEFGTLEPEGDEGPISSGISVDALLIKDRNLIQLNRPFPFYVRKNDFGLGTRSIDDMVRMLDYNLEQYYKNLLIEKVKENPRL